MIKGIQANDGQDKSHKWKLSAQGDDLARVVELSCESASHFRFTGPHRC